MELRGRVYQTTVSQHASGVFFRCVLTTSAEKFLTGNLSSLCVTHCSSLRSSKVYGVQARTPSKSRDYAAGDSRRSKKRESARQGV